MYASRTSTKTEADRDRIEKDALTIWHAVGHGGVEDSIDGFMG